MTARTIASDGVDELQTALADDAGFEAWYRRSLPRVYSYLVSRSGGDVALAEDLTQQTFIAAIDQRSRYDGRSDTITWLCGIARHKLADHFRAIERDERRQMRMEVRQIELDGSDVDGTRTRGPDGDRRDPPLAAGRPARRHGLRRARRPASRRGRPVAREVPQRYRVPAVPSPRQFPASLRHGEPR